MACVLCEAGPRFSCGFFCVKFPNEILKGEMKLDQVQLGSFGNVIIDRSPSGFECRSKSMLESIKGLVSVLKIQVFNH